MNAILDRLNLRPQERRFIVVVGAIMFIVANFWFVWPHFGDWRKAQDELAKARKTLEKYQKESEPTRLAEFQARLKQVDSSGASIPAYEQSLELARAIQNYAVPSGVNIKENRENTLPLSETNTYFEEKARTISFEAEEKDLVKFLLSIGSSNSIIRVRTLTLSPDATGTRLKGDILLVASYQRNRIQKIPESPAAAKTAKPSKPVARTNAVPPTVRVNSNGPAAKPKLPALPGSAPDRRKNEPSKKL